MRVITPPNTHPIDELYICLSVDANGNEGIVASYGTEAWMPLMSSERRHIPKFEKMVREMADQFEPGMRVRIVTFKRDSERHIWGAS